MFMYFPDNYVRSMAVVSALNTGGFVDEVDRACRPLLQASLDGDDAGTELFYTSWLAVIDRLVAEARDREEAGQLIGAGELYYRASLYTSTAERLQSPSWPGRAEAYRRSMDFLSKHIALSGAPVTRVEIPFEDSAFPAYFHRADTDGTAPLILLWNGLDSTKEMQYFSGFPRMLAERGISTLMVDTPGSGEALRSRGLTARYDTEVWAAAIIDWVESCSDALNVDLDQIGIVGWSLGGYYAPRAAAFEKRLKLAVAWGANHDWAAVQDARRNREGENPVPHYWDHVFWVWGARDMSDFIEKTRHVHLNGVAEKITVPLLVTHGVDDRQIPVRYAHETFDQAVNSPDRRIRLFAEPEGGTEHVSIDNLPYVASFTADWVDDTFRGLRS